MKDWLDEFFDLNPDSKQEEVVAEKKVSTLDLKDELEAMDMRDFSFYSRLTDEQKKEFSPWVLMRFMSSSTKLADHHLTMVNLFVNHDFNSLSRHPELQWKLLALCGTGRKQFHPWIAPPKGVKKNPVEAELAKHFPLLKDSDIDLMLELNSVEDLKEYFKSSGYSDQELKNLFKEKKSKKGE